MTFIGKTDNSIEKTKTVLNNLFFIFLIHLSNVNFDFGNIHIFFSHLRNIQMIFDTVFYHLLLGVSVKSLDTDIKIFFYNRAYFVLDFNADVIIYICVWTNKNVII